MVVVNYSEFRKNLKENLDSATDDKDVDDVDIVARPNNKNVVIISFDKYNSWQETRYLLNAPHNAKRLIDAIKRGEQGIFEIHDLIEE